MDVSRRYREAWEGYWSATSDTPGEAIWDSDPSLTSVPHTELLLPHADTSLPVVDLGCGNGTQTRYLATRFSRAIGVDLSHAAIAHARHADPEGVAEFAQLDLVDAEAVAALHERTGDTNVYMRAVIHQSEPEARAAVAAAVAVLVGERGRAFVVEPTPASKDVLQQVAQGPDGPPEKLRRVLAHGLKPASSSEEEVRRLLQEAGLTTLADGATALAQTEYLPDGTRVALPARWFVLGPAERRNGDGR
ncbi:MULTISPECIES: class I SAM-dependent methyltransferase [unclassified Streptomyces]|uniref:class I SAM-dependent methyltransferase n=1 Tax=unclassified Streptomyces TaxID=2593676 RepID=UPI00081B78AD|nr:MULTISPECIES: class I SAM-dependent methyltransferase [unclassified Streptomyces]MYQ89592.1 methyltransferase domain-containing protein [Streptomyces sp. SID4936]SCE58916.1 Methyltransferase domain-containing protein [Streptomyces sp. DvalAA-43]